MYEAYTFLAWLFCLLCMDAVYQCPPMKAWSCFHGVLHLYRFCERKDYPAAVKQFHAEISGAHVVQRTLLNIRTFAHQRSCNSSFFLPGPEDANMGTRAWDLWPQSASPKLQNSQPYFLFDSFSFFFLQTSTAQMFFFFYYRLACKNQTEMTKNITEWQIWISVPVFQSRSYLVLWSSGDFQVRSNCSSSSKQKMNNRSDSNCIIGIQVCAPSTEPAESRGSRPCRVSIWGQLGEMCSRKILRDKQ